MSFGFMVFFTDNCSLFTDLAGAFRCWGDGFGDGLKQQFAGKRFAEVGHTTRGAGLGPGIRLVMRGYAHERRSRNQISKYIVASVKLTEAIMDQMMVTQLMAGPVAGGK